MIFIGNKSEEQIDKEVDLMYDDLEKMVKKKQKERHIRLAKEAQENYESNVTAKISIQVNEKPCGTVFTGRKRG